MEELARLSDAENGCTQTLRVVRVIVTVASNPVSLAGLTTQCGTGLKLGSSRGVGTLVLDLACGGWFRWKTGPVCQHTVDT